MSFIIFAISVFYHAMKPAPFTLSFGKLLVTTCFSPLQAMAMYNISLLGNPEVYHTHGNRAVDTALLTNQAEVRQIDLLVE